MSKFPGPYDVYNLSQNFLGSIEGSFRGTGDDTSLTNSKIIHIGSMATERMIAFTAFIESYKINLQKEVTEAHDHDKAGTFFTDVDGNLSISLTINIPAHSVNESVNNIAKLEELQRLIKTGEWTDIVNISPIGGVNTPLLLVHFANLITNSRAVKSFKINSFSDLIKKGYPCFVDSIVFEPDVEAGFFEFHHGKTKSKDRNFLYPKNIKLSLELKYESVNTHSVANDYKDKLVISSFTSKGQFKQENYVKKRLLDDGSSISELLEKRVDDGMFPFHANGIKNFGENLQKMSIKKMNDLSVNSLGEKIDSFIFVGFHSDDASNNEKSILELKQNKDFLHNDFSYKHVMFKPSITSFKRSLNVTNNESGTERSTPSSAIFSELGSSAFKSLDYDIGFDLVSNSLAEAYQNCAKIQYLMRLFLKKNYSNSEAIEQAGKNIGISNTVHVYVPSFIESGKGGQSLSYDAKNILENKSVILQFINLNVEVDMESGFYEDGEKLFPKKMSISCTFKSGNENMILGYNYSFHDEKEPQWELAIPATGTGPWDASEPWLFPYNRKTVKIGGS